MSENENIENIDVDLEAEQTETVAAPAKTAKSDKPKKAKSGGKKSKPGVSARISRWWREMKSELKKVLWPSKKQTLNNTWVVILCVIFVGIFIWAFDWVSNSTFDALINLFKG